jgi:hypothetical protein
MHGELKQQVAAESSLSHELLLLLEHEVPPIHIITTTYDFWMCCLFPAELKQQVAAESSLSHELLLQLEHAQREGPAAQQLARLRAELAEREEEQLCQRCRWVVCWSVRAQLFCCVHGMVGGAK